MARHVRQRLWLTVFALITATASLAHEGHAHADDGIPLWKIVLVVVVAVAVYFAVNAILKRRQQNSTTASRASDNISDRS